MKLILLSSLLFALEVPYLAGPVVDEAHLLNPTERQRITAELEGLNATGKVQMAVLIAASLNDQDIESYALAVAEKWKLGEKKRDNGIILVVAPTERKMRLEVGYGLEGDVPDAYAKRILDDDMLPLFRQRRFADGIRMAIFRVGEHLKLVEGKPPVRRSNQIPLGRMLPYIPLGLIFLVFFASRFATPYGRRRRGGFWDGGYGGGGFGGGGFGGGGFGGGGGFSGGGGGFGGGGASSGW